jgi:succinylglutamic semialdehyde dehydrogenase
MGKLRVGPPDQTPEPFMGPLITEAAADHLMRAQEKLQSLGGRSIVPLRRLESSKALLSPGLIDMTGIDAAPDQEWFGPLLQVIRVHDFDSAIVTANRTAFGLAAGLISDDPLLFQAFLRRVRAGIINWNHQLTGASGLLPFGGVGHSGNHRPSGYFAADYCSYPVGSIESEKVSMPVQLPPGIEG